MDLLLIRHAEPVRVAEGEVDGPADAILHERGVRQAERLASWLADEPLDAVYASPLRRAQQTAAAVASVHNVPVVTDDDLAEFDRTAGFYIPVEEMRRTRDPKLLAMAQGDFSHFDADPVAFQERVVAGVERIIAANPGRKVAVVCHGGVVNAYVGHVAGVAALLWFDVAYTGISRLVASRSGIRSIVCLNESAHLRGTGLLLA